ncbi:MAG: hypothetical protein Q9227_003868 [Pyrenula ochraceoflavens]
MNEPSPPALSQSNQSISALANPSWFLSAPFTANIRDHPAPSLEDHPHSVLVRIRYTGVCGSDVHFWTHGGFTRHVSPDSPIILGHEASGTIHSIGSAVPPHLFTQGDHVAIEPGTPCRTCPRCKEGRYNLCAGMKFAAAPPGTHGTLTRYFRAPADFCYKLPKGVGLEEGVLVEPLAVAVHAVKLVGVKPGDSVIVFGSGTVGLLCMAVARAFGAKKIVAVDILEAKLEVAKEFAGAEVFRPHMSKTAEENAADLIKAGKLGEGADVAIEASGAESSVNNAIHALRIGGAFVQAGLGKAQVNFPILRMSEKELNVKGCFRYGPGDFSLALDLLEMGRISVKKLITKVVPFGNAIEAWETTRRGLGVKTLIEGVEDTENGAKSSPDG